MQNSVILKSSHIIIDASVAVPCFGDSIHALISYKEDSSQLLLSWIENSFFSKLHECHQVILKQKDLKGSVSVPVRDVIIDYDLDDFDRALTFDFNTKNRFIKIDLN
tara:strand:+ start:320 stop:640 length:321 start_codon:yes stop_codon:yes gene_type:complete